MNKCDLVSELDSEDIPTIRLGFFFLFFYIPSVTIVIIHFQQIDI